MRRLLNAPAAAAVRRITVWARRDNEIARILERLLERTAQPPLEQLQILREVRPRAIGGHDAYAVRLAAIYPRLQLYAERDTIRPLLTDIPSHSQAIAGGRRSARRRDARSARPGAGRALTSREPVVRDAALDRIAALGEQGTAYVDLLILLLQPGLGPTRTMIETLRALGPIARRALPTLVKIPGRASHYDRETRSATGTLIRDLR